VYKVELTEKEAKDLGEKRWVGKNKWRYLLALLTPVAVVILFASIASPKALNISDWITGPIVTGLLLFDAFILWRGMRLCTEAGKAFIQSLKEEK
jgi:hypothetical protein